MIMSGIFEVGGRELDKINWMIFKDNSIVILMFICFLVFDGK